MEYKYLWQLCEEETYFKYVLPCQIQQCDALLATPAETPCVMSFVGVPVVTRSPKIVSKTVRMFEKKRDVKEKNMGGATFIQKIFLVTIYLMLYRGFIVCEHKL